MSIVVITELTPTITEYRKYRLFLTISGNLSRRTDSTPSFKEKRRSGVIDFIYIKSEHSEVRFDAEAGDILVLVIILCPYGG